MLELMLGPLSVTTRYDLELEAPGTCTGLPFQWLPCLQTASSWTLDIIQVVGMVFLLEKQN